MTTNLAAGTARKNRKEVDALVSTVTAVTAALSDPAPIAASTPQKENDQVAAKKTFCSFLFLGSR
jgi:hypothetical protein